MITDKITARAERLQSGTQRARDNGEGLVTAPEPRSENITLAACSLMERVTSIEPALSPGFADVSPG